EAKRSKVGGDDDTVVVNSERMRWAAPVLAYLASGPAWERLFPWDYQQFGRLVQGAGGRLGIEVAPRQDRHSGISLDPAFHLRGPPAGASDPVGATAYFLNLLSGVGGVARAARLWKFETREYDLRGGPAGDLLRKCVQSQVLASLRRGLVLAVMMAPPCTSLSIAQNSPRSIRSKQHPRGLPRLPADTKAK
ncbi:unnamed protein product, partial [Prorocentrum cordatum]